MSRRVQFSAVIAWFVLAVASCGPGNNGLSHDIGATGSAGHSGGASGSDGAAGAASGAGTWGYAGRTGIAGITGTGGATGMAGDTGSGGTTGLGVDGGSTALELDCRPRTVGIARFTVDCQYIGGNVPIVVCDQIGGPGSLRITILHPERVAVGAQTPIGGSDPTVTVEIAATIDNLLIETLAPGGLGFVVFDVFEVGARVRGSFLGASVDVAPDPVFSCHLSSSEFDASAGPGVRD